MSEFVVQRSYGRCIDFLMDWDAQYGTACAGLPLAMRFQDKAEAFGAAQRANDECRGERGQKKPPAMHFQAVRLNQWGCCQND